MKKSAFFIVLLFSLFISADQVFAAPNAGLLRGEKFNVTNNAHCQNAHLWTDGKENQGGEILNVSCVASYNFSVPHNINGYYFSATANAIIKFYDIEGNLLDSKKPTTLANEYEPIEVNNVTKVTITATTAYTYIAEVDLSGAEVGETAPPKNLKVIKSGKGYAEIEWDSVLGARGYYVYVNDKKISDLITSTNYRATVESDVENKIFVTAYNGKESGASNMVTSFFDTTPPPPPTLTVEELEEAIRLSWTKTANDITSYEVYRDDEFLSNTKLTTLTVNAEYNVNHGYHVIAVDQDENKSLMSNKVNAKALLKRDTVPPSKPLGLEGESAEGAITVSWRSNVENDLAGYYVYLNGRQYGDMIEATTITIYGLADLTTYKVRVAAVDHSGNVSNLSDEISVKTSKKADTTPPAAPVNLTAALASNYLSILLSWGAVNEADVIGYYVYVSDDDLIYNQVNSKPVSSTGYSFTKIEGNQTYYFKVAAVDASGNISEKTKSVSVKVPTRDPNEEVNKKNELLVTWNEIKGAVNYLIYFNGVLIATTDNQTFSFVIGEQYGYTGQPPVNVEVKARFEDGSTGYDKNLSTQSKWGFSVVDLWQTVQSIVVSVGSFFLLGIAIRFAPRIFRLIKEAVLKRRHSQ